MYLRDLEQLLLIDVDVIPSPHPFSCCGLLQLLVLLELLYNTNPLPMMFDPQVSSSDIDRWTELDNRLLLLSVLMTLANQSSDKLLGSHRPLDFGLYNWVRVGDFGVLKIHHVTLDELFKLLET